MFPFSFAIIGAQKSASTFLHECLREHPEVFMPRYETAFFENPEYDESQIGQLHNLLKPGVNHKMIGIKRPDYLARPECPSRLAYHAPEAKLIIVLRNPIMRFVSAYYWYMQVGIIPIRPLDEALPQILNGDYLQKYPKSSELLDYGFYAQHLQRYFQVFEREQLFILFHKDVKHQPLETVKQLYHFLEIVQNYQPKALERKPKQTVYALPRVRFLAEANKTFFYDYTYQDERLVLQPKDGELRKNLYRGCVFLDRYVLSHLFENEKPILTSEQYNQLLAIYAEDIDCLETLLKVDLDSWRKRS